MSTLAAIFSALLAVFFPSGTDGTVKGESVVVDRLPVIAQRTVVEQRAVPSVTATAAGVWDPVARTFLSEKNVDKPLAIASITKLMTALLVLEQPPILDETLTLGAADNDAGGSRLRVPTGTVLTGRDLLAAMLVASANNAAEALARLSGRTEDEFVQTMNTRARELGMPDTHFTDVTGLGSGNISTVRDLTVLSAALEAFPEIADLTSKKSVTIRLQNTGRTMTALNTDGLVGSDINIVYGKTGFSDAAGGCLLTRIRSFGGRELLVVVLGSTNQTARFRDTRALADWAFASTK
ncbi:MAG: D-alanyl-D-alanine carboxypeptidase [Candidatus Kerfeldbacteria bacterium]|nr:D-alanyl-D-alanine carboxypeptidase [Candidatus Kerfeldbacteria bacterium]